MIPLWLARLIAPTSSVVASISVFVGLFQFMLRLLDYLERLRHPGDASLSDTVTWMLIFATPLWLPFLLSVSLVVGIGAYLGTMGMARKRNSN